VKKIEVHLFPEKTEESKAFRFSWLRLAFWILGIGVAVTGFLVFSPLSLWEKVADGRLLSLYRGNQEIRKTIDELKKSTEAAHEQWEEVSEIRESTLFLGGAVGADSVLSFKQPGSQTLAGAKQTFRRFLDSLEANPGKAAALPVLHPLKNHTAIINRFQMIYDHLTEQPLPHRGIDFSGGENDTVIAPGDGIVSEIQNYRGFGLSLKLDHTPELKTFYAHLQKPLVAKGARVHRGDPIAVIAKSGRTSGAALHYELRFHGESVNPEDFFLTP
jgi:murein DD-endopeptidase MepM/ murein hydrolase activator NlpD